MATKKNRSGWDEAMGNIVHPKPTKRSSGKARWMFPHSLHAHPPTLPPHPSLTRPPQQAGRRC